MNRRAFLGLAAAGAFAQTRRPNIVLILIDDCGFGQYGTFAGGIPSPTMDRLAKEGLRYNHFHTTALCSPFAAGLVGEKKRLCVMSPMPDVLPAPGKMSR